MKGLSKKEIELISSLEFEEKYFFTKEDVAPFITTENQRRHIIHKLMKKKRIIKLNKSKYYLIPIKAKTGKWYEDSFVMVDEVLNGDNYFIGGWAAANYWKLTDQIAMKIEVYTTKRQGIRKFLTTTIIFRRTSPKRLKEAVIKSRNNHNFKILNKKESKKWMTTRK